MQHRVGGLRQVDPLQLQVALLPRRKVSVSPFGVNMWGLYYSGTDLLREGWLHRSTEINRPESLEAAYDPASADTIYLFPQAGSRIYWECSLTDRSRQFRGLTFWQVWDIQAEEKHNKANAKLIEDAKRRELDAFIKSKTVDAIKQSPSVTEPDQQRIQQIRSNKKSARDAERQNRTKSVTVDPGKPLADVVPLKPADDDYSFPHFVPELFDDGQGDAE